MASYAIVPAAGKSRRMGRPKLTLPYRGSTLLAVLLRRWLESKVSRVVVVVRSGSQELRQASPQSPRIQWVEVDDPPQMKDSVMAALQALQQAGQLTAADSWLLAPADLPFLSPQVINRLLQQASSSPVEEGPHIYVPVAAAAGEIPERRRGHPVLFPAALAAEVEKLGPEQGVNGLLERWPVREVECGPELRFQDIDTPEDYRRLQSKERK